MPHAVRRFRGGRSTSRKKTWVTLKTGIGDLSGIPGFATSFGLATTVPPEGGSTRDTFVAMSGDGSGLSPFQSTLPENSTILRIRGALDYPSTDTSSSSGVENSFGIGVTAISDNVAKSYPAPISDGDWDGWMFLRNAPIDPLDGVGTNVDVKSMRKLEDGEALFVVAESVGIGTTPSGIAAWTVTLRVLLLLS